jgi:hypothetical protein
MRDGARNCTRLEALFIERSTDSTAEKGKAMVLPVVQGARLRGAAGLLPFGPIGGAELPSSLLAGRDSSMLVARTNNHSTSTFVAGVRVTRSVGSRWIVCRIWPAHAARKARPYHRF